MYTNKYLVYLKNGGIVEIEADCMMYGDGSIIFYEEEHGEVIAEFYSVTGWHRVYE